MNWEWIGSEDPNVLSGTMSLDFTSCVVVLDLPNARLAHVLGQSISREIRLAREEGRQELSDEIRRAIEPPAKG